MSIRLSPSGPNVFLPSNIQGLVALALGQYAPALIPAFIGGRNRQVAVAPAVEDLWEPGGTYTFLPAAALLEVVSSSASDTGSGVGARSIAVSCLDANGYPMTLTATLNGVTPVSLGAVPAWRTQSVVVTAAGSSESNVGDITVRTVVGATTQGFILAAQGLSQQWIYTVPRGYSMVPGSFLIAIYPSGVSGGSNCQIDFQQRIFGTGAWITLATWGVDDFVSSSDLYAQPPISLPERTDVRFRCRGASGNVDVAASMIITLADPTVVFT